MPIRITFDTTGRTINFVSRDLIKSFGHQEYYPFGSLNPFVDEGFVSATLIHRTDAHYELFRVPFDIFEDAEGNTFASAQEVVDHINSVSSGTTEAGFLDYNHDDGLVNLVADTWTDVPNNGAGAFTNKNYLPAGVTEIIDTSTGYLDFSQLQLGDQILTRDDFTVNPSTNNCLLEVRYVLGQGAGEYALSVLRERLDNGSGVDYQKVLLFAIYMGDENTRGGVGKLQVKLSTSGTLTNAGSYINVIRR